MPSTVARIRRSRRRWPFWAALDADVLLLTSVDYDRDLVALGLLADRLARAGHPYPYRFALRPNTGLQTGLDLDGDGRTGEPEDAQGWGLFSGQAGMAVLSRLPIDQAGVRDFSTFLWADLPGNLIPPGTAPKSPPSSACPPPAIGRCR